MKLPRPLDTLEQRVLGALLEKEQTTPDAYPLTVNTLIAACNQKTGRDPVMQLSETQVVDALERLRQHVLVWRSEGARVERWSQSLSRRLSLNPGSKAILTLLFLRGAQTAGELRTRSGRMHSFDTVDDVAAALQRMAEGTEPLVVELARRPGQKETRWTHLLGSEVDQADEPAGTTASTGSSTGTSFTGPSDEALQAAIARAPAGTPPGSGLRLRVEELEDEVKALREELQEARGELATLKDGLHELKVELGVED